MAHKETYKDAPLAPVDVGIEVGVAVPYSLFQRTVLEYNIVDIRIDVPYVTRRIMIIITRRGDNESSIILYYSDNIATVRRSSTVQFPFIMHSE